MEFEKFSCPNCGESLVKRPDGMYYCNHCGCSFTDVTMERTLDKIRQTLGELVSEVLLQQKEEQIACIRRNLFKATHAEYLDTDQILSYCHDMKKLFPEDFQANFYEVACKDNIVALNSFVTSIDMTDSYYVDLVLTFLLKLIKSGTLLLINEVITSAYEKNNIEKYKKWQEIFQNEARKVDDGVYDVTLIRDVFVAYKSEDMSKVIEIVDYLEQEEGLSCFVASRNLQHGRVVDYDKKLQQAIDNCKAILFVSSKKSRRGGDAREKELPYVKQVDLSNAPIDYKIKNDYKSIPKRYKKPRVEYVVEEYLGLAAESAVAEFFNGYERCYDYTAVAESLFEQFKLSYEETSKSQVSLKTEDIRAQVEQTIRQMEEERKAKTNAINPKLPYNLKDFKIKDGVLEKYIGNEVDVIIPDCVTSIGKEAFYERYDLHSVTIPDSVTSMDRNVFFKCKYLERVAIGKGLKSLSLHAFAYCSNLKSVTIPDNITTIGESVFADCINLTSVTIPSSVTEIGQTAFCGCKNLKNLSIPSSVTSIGTYAFCRCQNLTNMVIPKGVAVIREGAFSDCSNLTKITIPDGVKSIEKNAFNGCRNLQSVIIPNSVTSIGAGAFYQCSSLQSITLPDGIKKISDSSFWECERLTEIKIPNGVTVIEGSAFHSCSRLKSVFIPNGVVDIKYCAFNRCSSLTHITMPDSVKTIGNDAFYACSSLVNATLSSGITSIGNTAFQKCDALKTILYNGAAKQWKLVTKGKNWKPSFFTKIVFAKKK